MPPYSAELAERMSKVERERIGLIGAMQVEIEALVEHAVIEKKEELASMIFYVGTLSGTPCVIANCGAGKVNAAICAQIMLDLYQAKALINLGIAGGIGKDVHIGDLVVATACVEYDYDTSACGTDDQPGEVFLPGPVEKIMEFPCDQVLSQRLLEEAKRLYSHVHSGVVATGDQFVASGEMGLRLNRQFQAISCEMEGAAVAHVCFLNHVPCAVLRSISDNANENGEVDFHTFAQESAHKAQRLMEGVLGSL